MDNSIYIDWDELLDNAILKERENGSELNGYTILLRILNIDEQLPPVVPIVLY